MIRTLLIILIAVIGYGGIAFLIWIDYQDNKKRVNNIIKKIKERSRIA